jgi:hypothetical protein
MNDHSPVWLGGGTTLMGGIGAILVNVLHPRPPVNTEELLSLVASSPHWTIMPVGAALTAVLVVAGLALLVRTRHQANAYAVGEAGRYITVLGGAAFLVAIMQDADSRVEIAME